MQLSLIHLVNTNQTPTISLLATGLISDHASFSIPHFIVDIMAENMNITVLFLEELKYEINEQG